MSIDFLGEFANALHESWPLFETDRVKSKSPHLDCDSRLGLVPVNFATQRGDENFVALAMPLLLNIIALSHLQYLRQKGGMKK